MSDLKSAELYHTLRSRIIEGTYAPGDRLILRRLAVQFDVSEIPVREAIRMLERDGLVQVVPYTGARVATLSAETVRESLFVRGHLESLATGLAAERIDSECLQKLDGIVAQMDVASAQREAAVYAGLNREFHSEIIAASGNRVLRDTLADLESSQVGFQALFRLFPRRFEVSLREHKEIVRHLRAGDARAASAVALAHKLSAAADLEASIAEQELADAAEGR